MSVKNNSILTITLKNNSSQCQEFDFFGGVHIFDKGNGIPDCVEVKINDGETDYEKLFHMLRMNPVAVNVKKLNAHPFKKFELFFLHSTNLKKYNVQGSYFKENMRLILAEPSKGIEIILLPNRKISMTLEILETNHKL